MATTLLLLCLIFIILDIPYLLTVGGNWSKMVEKIQQSPMTVNIPAAIVVYGFLSIGLYNLVLSRNLSTRDTVLYSGLLGLTTYGVFNFTNMALFEEYDTTNALIDTAWGGIVTAGAGYLAKTYLM